MFRELLAIHALLRRDLRTVRRLADEARRGVVPQTLLAEIRNLQTNSPLWRLQYGCMHYCRFLHTHHTIEDAAVFPMVCRHDPSLNRVIDMLEEDHLRIHHLTEDIVAAAEHAVAEPAGTHQQQVIALLEALEAELVEHLELEERSIGPLLSTWDHWPIDE